MLTPSCVSRSLRRAVLGTCALVWTLGLAGVAVAEGIDLGLSCPDQVRPGGPILLRVRLTNPECRPLSVRLISSLVGNAASGGDGEPTGTIGILGPKVAGTVTVPPATDTEPAYCDQGVCFGTFLSCFRDEECRCRPGGITPGEATFDVPAADPFPASFAAIQARQFVVADVPGTDHRAEAVCTVPEPAEGASVAAALAALSLLGASRGAHQRR